MKKVKAFIVKTLKTIYRMLPIKLEIKQRIKNKLSAKIKIVNRISDYNDNHLNKARYITNYDIDLKSANSLDKINKTIAVHLHLYYVDLSDEFIKYLKNIPYKFDLLISIQENQNKEDILTKFKKIKNVKNVIVKKSKNVGRDFSPMFVLFKKDIQKYDYLLHMHTKKSIRTGKEQDGWRTHMLKGVLGNADIIKKIFYQFENNKDIGLIYPETYEDMPYWAHTWLKNSEKCNKIANSLGFSLEDRYIDYSVGSFFWVRTSSISNFLNLNYTWDDFGKEEGLADGTLAHAIERMIPQVIINNDYKLLVLDIKNNVLRYKGLKNLYQYNSQSKEQCLSTLMQYDIISFDIFDTLITRQIISPDKIFDILEKKVESKYKLKNFKKLRTNAEYNVRVDKKFINDCSINEIYAKLLEMTQLNKENLNKIKQEEIDLELKYIIPRKDMLDIYVKLKNANKEIILISDMYLTSDIIKKMLNKCGYKNWDKLLVSSEVGLRKDNGTIWDYYFKEYVKEKKSIHVGDNEQSDIQQLCDMGKPFYHVMQPKKMYKLIDYSDYISQNSKLDNISDNVMLGLIINKLIYNSPFKNHDSEYIIENFHDFGYIMLAPLILKYFTFLYKNTKDKGYDKLLFLAREGYYLQKIYKDFCKSFKLKEIENVYFLTSRRSTSVACIENIRDAKDILSMGYEGKLNNLFKVRLGIDDKDIPEKFVKSIDDKDEIFKVLNEKFDKYYPQFKEEATNYKKYCNKHIKPNSNVAVVDLGYSGTIQYYLMKLTNINIDGYYFTLSDNIKPQKLGGKCYGCYDSKSLSTEKNIYLFSSIIETFLTAPYGQLIKFDDKLNPIYKEENINKNLLKYLDDIYEGIKDFINDIAELLGMDLLEKELSNELVSANFSSLVYIDNIISNKIKDIFELENSYTLDSKINVFDYLNLVYIKNK